jgi:hypothetical protein
MPIAFGDVKIRKAIRSCSETEGGANNCPDTPSHRVIGTKKAPTTRANSADLPAPEAVSHGDPSPDEDYITWANSSDSLASSSMSWAHFGQ